MSNVRYNRTHLVNLLYNVLSDQDPKNDTDTAELQMPGSVTGFDLTLGQQLKSAIDLKLYRDPSNLLSRLNIKINKKYKLLTIGVSNVSDNLRHSNSTLNRVLHQAKYLVFDTKTYTPMFYVENHINGSDISLINKENTYLDEHLYRVTDYKNAEFDRRVACYTHHIGAYIVIFAVEHHDKVRWMFGFEGKTYTLCIEKHAVLFEHISEHLHKLDPSYCYHIMLVDQRLRIPLQSPSDDKYMVLVKVNRVSDLVELKLSEFNHMGVFVENKPIHFSCLDHLDFYLEELNDSNTRNKKLYNRGLLVKVDVDSNFDKAEYVEPICIVYDTYTYKRLSETMPKYMNIHEAHLHLYQKDKLNSVLQYTEDSDNAALIVTRINLAMVTLGREILDIYHLTRNKEHTELFNMLSYSYKNILHSLHGKFIQKKNTASFQTLDIIKHAKHSSSHSIVSDYEKVSITTEDVYILLKNTDTPMLVQLFLDRDELRSMPVDSRPSSSSSIIHNIIKDCNSTSLQTRLLR